MRTKILGLFVIMLGVFLFTGIASADTASMLQPAGIVYDEGLTINGELRATSLRIGQKYVGGVTYLNGTILNDGPDVPVTIGDELRVDGQIWGGLHKGNEKDQGLKIADTILPGETNLNDIGSSRYKWKNLYLSGMLQGENAKFTGEVDFSNATLKGVSNDSNIDANTLDGYDSSDFLMLAGGTMAGTLTVNGVSGLTDGDLPDTLTASNYLPIAGGTMTGVLNADAGIDTSSTVALAIGATNATALNITPATNIAGLLTTAGGLVVNGTANVSGLITANGGLTVAGGQTLTLTGATVTGLNAFSVVNTPTGTISATDIQTAVNELDNEKLALAGGTITGTLDVNQTTQFVGGYGDTGVTISEPGDINLDGEITSMGGGISQFSIMQINTELNTENSDANSILSGGFLEIPNSTEDKATSAASECDDSSEYGKIFLEYDDGDLWVCTQSGWVAK